MNTKTTVISQAELDAQFACCDKIAAYWQTKGRSPTAYVETYGCQQNEADSEKLRGFLAQCGYAIVGSAEEKSAGGNIVRVQVPPPALKKEVAFIAASFFFYRKSPLNTKLSLN